MAQMANVKLYLKKGCFVGLTNDLKDYHDIKL